MRTFTVSGFFHSLLFHCYLKKKIFLESHTVMIYCIIIYYNTLRESRFIEDSESAPRELFSSDTNRCWVDDLHMWKGSNGFK